MLQVEVILEVFQKKYNLKSKKSVCEFLSISPASLSMSIKRNSIGSFFETILQKIELSEFLELLTKMQQETIDVTIAEKIFDKLVNFYDSADECIAFSKKLLLTLSSHKQYFLSILYKSLEDEPCDFAKNVRLHFNASVHYVSHYLKELGRQNIKAELQILQDFFDSLDSATLKWLLENKKIVRLAIEASLAKPPLL